MVLKPRLPAIRALHIATLCRDHIINDFILSVAIGTNQPHLCLCLLCFLHRMLCSLCRKVIFASPPSRYSIESRMMLGHNRHVEAGARVIELENVAYSYGGGELLSDISVKLAPGSFHFLTGPSGAGKTTLLKLCYGALLPSAGYIRLFQTDVRSLERDDVAQLRRKIGVVHQNVQFLDHLSVTDNVALPLTVSGRQAEVAGNDLPELMNWVGLTNRADAKPPELSGGERQRAALARAVIMSPDIVLADEPTGNIDWEMSQRLLTLLVELNRMGKTVLIATHDLSLIRAAKAQVQARVLRISNRRVQLAGADL